MSLGIPEVHDHSFLSKEVLIPNLNNTDCSRVNMFDSHIDQSVVLANGEFPRVFTNFENQVGHHSSSYRVSDRNWMVVSKIIKNEENFLLVVRDQNNYVDVVWRKPGERITEYFGYKNINDGLDSRKAREEIKEGEVLHHSTAYDENLNFRFGTNLKAIYSSYKGLTYEDAIVISKSAAEKMKSYTLEEVSISVNTNDVLINLYGNNQVYKSFPDIGEHTKKKILAARRRINYNSIFFDHSRTRLNSVNYANDTCFYSEGIVVDIDVFCNADLEELSNKPYNQQIVRYLKGNLSFYQRVVDILEPIINRKGLRNYSDDTAFLYRKAKEMLDPEIRWHSDNSDFDNFIIKFLVIKEQQLAIGSKLTNRYGGKGCISAILPDEEMPTAEDGERADVILNSLGVVNRLNPAQLYEQELNFLGNYIRNSIKYYWENEKEVNEEDGREYKFTYNEYLLFDFLRDINPSQSEWLKEKYDNLDYEGQVAFWEETIEKGIYIHQPPFFGNITFEQLRELYKTYPDCRPKKFIGIERPLIIGEMYFMKLKHEAISKFSARSSSYLNIKNTPSKSTKFKENQQLYSRTPVKVGEMELTNLLLCNNEEEVARFMKAYSTSDIERKNLITHLLKDDVFQLNKVEVQKDTSCTRQILDAYLAGIGLELERNCSEKPVQENALELYDPATIEPEE